MNLQLDIDDLSIQTETRQTTSRTESSALLARSPSFLRASASAASWRQGSLERETSDRSPPVEEEDEGWEDAVMSVERLSRSSSRALTVMARAPVAPNLVVAQAVQMRINMIPRSTRSSSPKTRAAAGQQARSSSPPQGDVAWPTDVRATVSDGEEDSNGQEGSALVRPLGLQTRSLLPPGRSPTRKPGGAEVILGVTNRVRERLEQARGSVAAAWAVIQGRHGNNIVTRIQLERGLMDAGVSQEDAQIFLQAMDQMSKPSSSSSPSRQTSKDNWRSRIADPAMTLTNLQAALAPGGMPQRVVDAVRRDMAVTQASQSTIADALFVMMAVSGTNFRKPSRPWSGSLTNRRIASPAMSLTNLHASLAPGGMPQRVVDVARRDMAFTQASQSTIAGDLFVSVPASNRSLVHWRQAMMAVSGTNFQQPSRRHTSLEPDGFVGRNINVGHIPHGISHRDAKTILESST